MKSVISAARYQTTYDPPLPFLLDLSAVFGPVSHTKELAIPCSLLSRLAIDMGITPTGQLLAWFKSYPIETAASESA